MPKPRDRAPAAVLLALVAGLALGACTGDDEPTKSASTPSAPAPSSAPIDVAPGKLTGRIGRAARDAAVADVAQVVDGWFEAAYLGEYPRSDFSDAWPGFTRRLAGQARRESAVTSNAVRGAELTSVRATVRKVRVDLLSAKGRAVGATARFRLVLETPGTETITGRLSLSPVRGGWQVFEYQVVRR
ncbi:hypothetical protein ACLM5J_16185 [Nocardioides sp. Bht2]|uniref:hypothetical protein n=1 Tax=Nocardioides sp. Bht2 TaxID=3392297 RepID=UPI0039B52E4E